MDNYLNINRTRNYFLTMANLEANHLNSTANFVSNIHLNDAFLRMNFRDEIRRFIDIQLTTIRNAASDELCQQCIQNLKKENAYLNIQHRMLRTGEAAIYAAVSFYHEHENIIGYVIDGIGVVLGGLQIVAGLSLAGASVSSGNIIGAVVGANLVLSGLSSVQENVKKIITGQQQPGFMKKGYMGMAEFLGFDEKLGVLAYQTVDLTTSYYGLLKLTVKPEAWRLYNYLPGDYYRKVNTLSKPALALKVTGASTKLLETGSIWKALKEE
ncbi:DUF4225 domain-containing protein [Erwinia oleae]|uniref:DUF4225 domain-containing protein n=1 Tax=Erwinia oleae TaxID=796334 RepID=UPI000558E306|nr:DUF4225 domain-containing protein [Erwinia oleae]